MTTFDFVGSAESGPVIKVLGLGGGGGNAVEYMAQSGIEGVEFLCANTDVQALNDKQCDKKIQIGEQATRGLGAGANPELGKQAATEDQDTLKDTLSGTDMLFLTAGMGGGTGTGSMPVVAKIARELNILTVGVVTTPFMFEGKKRCGAAASGMTELAGSVDALIVISNDNVLKLAKGATIQTAFSMSNDVLRSAVQGIAELVTKPGLINLDFADVRTVMQSTGRCMMGTATAAGENRAADAAHAAINSPLLGSIDVTSAKGILVNITGGEDLRLDELSEVSAVFDQFESDETTVVIGTSLNPEMGDSISVTVVVAGVDQESRVQRAPIAAPNTSGYSAPKPARSFQLPPMPQSTAEPRYKAPAYAAAEPTPEPMSDDLFAQQNYDVHPTRRSMPKLSPVGAAKESAAIAINEEQENWMSIPTFLRRQSD